MKTQTQFYKIAGAIAIAGFLAGCGSQAYREGDELGQPQYDGGGFTNPSSDSGDSGDSGSTVTTGNAVAQSFSIKGTSAWTSAAVYTDNLLKVRIKPDTAPVIAGTNFTPSYNCISYNITVLGQSIRTEILKIGTNNINCPNAKTEQIIDFSGRLSPGHNSITLTIAAAQTDWKYSACFAAGPMPTNRWLWPNTTYNNCTQYGTMNNVYTTHSGAGLIEIQVNGTTL